MRRSTWPPRTAILVGIAVIAYGLLFAYFLMSMAYGGFLKSPLSERVIGFGAVVAVLVCGVALLSVGGCRLLCRRARSS